MLRRRREQRTYVGKELLVLQVPILFRRTTPTRIRKSHRRTNQRLRRQPLLRRRRRELAMCALVRITLLQSVRTAKATTPPTWLLASLEEHRDRGDFLLADGERIACACSWCWYVYFEEDRAAEERAACPHHQEEFSQRLSTV
ncbi:hypothetical protein PAHAL_1G243200 [Panicum hallii]|uniref:Uncharacterized protein n=1 Tax=Panicum hallii TaxID=206008 RepID=A0A2T8KW67_9POAL|nr:hypothetical protein PAHAL_1G243200 [Panicum hallii]